MILVIGYGNSLCGDDGIGPYAVEQLAIEDPDTESSGEITYLTLRQLMPELAEPISRAEGVIFVDAAVGGMPGAIVCQSLAASDEPDAIAARAFTHHVDPTALLDSAWTLYGNKPVASWLYTVTGKNFNLGDDFSPEVETALPELIGQLKARIPYA